MLQHRSRLTLALPVLAAFAIGCGGGDDGPTGNTTTCTALTGPTVHTGDITASETWTKCGNPHVVESTVDVAGASSPILTLGPGVIVRFAAGSSAGTAFRIGFLEPGGLVVNGTAAEPVSFTSGETNPAAGDYIGIVFHDNTVGSSIKHAIIQDCGAAASLSPGFEGCILAQATTDPVLIQDVTIKRSATGGITFGDLAEFATGSRNLNISSVVNFPISINATTAHTLPTAGTYTNNGKNRIRVWAYGDVTESATWADPGIPYQLDVVPDVSGASSPILTIAPGVEMKFADADAIRVGYLGEGGIVINGTAANPVTFGSGNASPAAGDFIGLTMHDGTVGSSIKHLVVEDCGAPAFIATGFEGCVIAQATAEPVLMQDVTIRRSQTGGVTFGDLAEWATGSTRLNISNVATYPIATTVTTAHTLPTSGTYANNGRNMVRLWAYEDITVSRSWINPGIPFLVDSRIDIDAPDAVAPDPILTVAPGSIFRMVRDSKIRIGSGNGGALVADGTPTEKITFTGDTATAGFWIGFEVADKTTPGAMKLDNVIVEYGGGFMGYVPGDEGNILIRPVLAGFITNSTIRNSAECGIVIARYANEGGYVDYAATGTGNTFANNPKGNVCGLY